MSRTRLMTIAALAAVLILLSGCASGSKNPALTPETSPTIHVGQALVIPGIFAEISESAVIRSGCNDAGQIALTFDAGWLYDQTIALLEVLDQYQVKATFFLRGRWVEDHPALAVEIRSRGHCLENHSLTHGHMQEMSEGEIREEISQTNQIIEEITGYTPCLFRPPYGEFDDRILQILGELGCPYMILWTLDSHDWAQKLNGVKITEEYLVQRILAKAEENSIILMHVGGYETVNALPKIITGLRGKGYTLVTVNEMLPPLPELVHIVRQGETLYSIAQLYGVSVEAIIAANQLE